LAIINVVLGLAFLLQDMGLSSYFIHRQDINHKEKSTLYAINLILGCIATVVVLLIAIPIGWFYDSQDISTGLGIVAINFIFIGATSQYQAHFIKSLQNHTLAKIDIFARLSLLASAAFMIIQSELGLFGYLYAVLVASIIKLISMLIIAPKDWHPKWTFDLQIVKPAMVFGGFQMGSQIINQLRTQVDQLIIGKVIGIEALGIYALAKELIMQPNKLIAPISSRLVLPRFAKLQSDVKALSVLFDKSITILLGFNAIVYLALTLAVFYILPVFFDKNYAQSFEIFSILLLIGLIRPSGSLLGLLAQAKGVSKVEFKWNMIASIVSISAIICAIPFKTLTAFAYAMVLSQLILSSSAILFFSKQLLPLKIINYWRNIFLLTLSYLSFMAYYLS